MEFSWSALWNITDETPDNCQMFLNCSGMSLFLDCLKVSNEYWRTSTHQYCEKSDDSVCVCSLHRSFQINRSCTVTCWGCWVMWLRWRISDLSFLPASSSPSSGAPSLHSFSFSTSPSDVVLSLLRSVLCGCYWISFPALFKTLCESVAVHLKNNLNKALCRICPVQ